MVITKDTKNRIILKHDMGVKIVLGLISSGFGVPFFLFGLGEIFDSNIEGLIELFLGTLVLLAIYYYVVGYFKEITFDNESGCIVWRSGSKGLPKRVKIIPRNGVTSIRLRPNYAIGGHGASRHSLSIIWAGKKVKLHGDDDWKIYFALPIGLKALQGLSHI